MCLVYMYEVSSKRVVGVSSVRRVCGSLCTFVVVSLVYLGASVERVEVRRVVCV